MGVSLQQDLHFFLLHECDIHEDVLLFTGLDEAIVGFGYHFNRAVAIYDLAKILALLTQQGMSIEEAEEHFSYNIAGAWSGPGTPVVLHGWIGTEPSP